MRNLGANEPEAGPWRVEAAGDVVAALLAAAGSPADRPAIIAVDGRGGAGKTTVSAVLARHAEPAAVVHTDDVAWEHSFFGWDRLLAEGVLEPLRRGEAVSYRPPGWEQKGREGAVTVDAGCRAVFVEGVGAARRELAALVDAAVWVQADMAVGERRCLEREGGTAEAKRFWDLWMAEEVPFLEDQRPWERAAVVVAGTTDIAYDPRSALVVAPPPVPR